MGISKPLIERVADLSRKHGWTSLETDMLDYRLLWKIRLCERHKPTGKTRRYVGGAEAPVPVELRIIEYPEEQGYYLFYCDGAGRESDDSYHESVEEAMAQAEWEFSVKPEEWEQCGQ